MRRVGWVVLFALIATAAFGQVPQVPAPPKPFKTAPVAASVLDTLILGGAAENAAYRRHEAAVRAYGAQLGSFLVGLAPGQLEAIYRDPVQGSILIDGIIAVRAQRQKDVDTAAATAPPATVPREGSAPRGSTVYDEHQCVGAVVNGQCHGSIMPDSGYHPTCYGQMINGMCTGPMF